MSANKQNNEMDRDSFFRLVSNHSQTKCGWMDRMEFDQRFGLFSTDPKTPWRGECDSVCEDERTYDDFRSNFGVWHTGRCERLRDAILDPPVRIDESLEASGVWVHAPTRHLLIQRRHWVSVLSSRIGKDLCQRERWFDALRTLGVQMRSQSSLLLTARGTIADPFVRRLGELFGIPVVELVPISMDLNVRPQIESISGVDDDDSQPAIYYSQSGESVEGQESRSPDQLLASLASLTVILSVRSGGNVIRSARSRLAFAADEDDFSQRRSTRLLIDRTLTKPKVEAELLDAGAVGWWLYDSDAVSENNVEKGESNDASAIDSGSLEIATQLTCDEVAKMPFLIHWTRRCDGPWPEQSKSSWIDDLIFKNSDRSHDALATLCRILASQRLIASNRLTRAAERVVCFSKMTFAEFANRRVFRSHLNRWDFEPYGVAFDPQWLSDLGCRSVIYGSEEDWDRMNSNEQIFFQLEKTKSNKGSVAIDWTLEREWRLVGDLDFSIVPREAALVFVRDEADVAKVSPLTDWPILVLSRSGSDGG